MVIKNVSLDIVCGITSKIPDTGRPEVAFAGKSNVGKSSLINGLMNARPWQEPAHSREKHRRSIFITLMSNVSLDLPGYATPRFLQQRRKNGEK